MEEFVEVKIKLKEYNQVTAFPEIGKIVFRMIAARGNAPRSCPRLWAGVHQGNKYKHANE